MANDLLFQMKLGKMSLGAFDINIQEDANNNCIQDSCMKGAWESYTGDEKAEKIHVYALKTER